MHERVRGKRRRAENEDAFAEDEDGFAHREVMAEDFNQSETYLMQE
jgi:hypothetical protein